MARSVVTRPAGEALRVAADLGLRHAQDLRLLERMRRVGLACGLERGAVLGQREPADQVVADDRVVAAGRPGRVARRVVDEDVTLVRLVEIEARLQAHAEHAVLGVAVVGAGRDRGDRGLVVRRAVGVVHLQEALRLVPLARTDLGPVDLAVGVDVERHRAVDVADQRRAPEVRPHGAGAVGLLALAGDPPDPADDVLDQVAVGLGVAGAEVPHPGVPRAPVGVGLAGAGAVIDGLALVELAPGHRMVLAHLVRAGVVRPLVERGEHVVVAADVALVVVVLVRDLVRVGQSARRKVVAVGDLDRRRVAGGRPGRVAGHRRADDAVRRAVPPVPHRLAGAHVGRVVDGGDAAAVLHIADHRVALRLCQQWPGPVAAGPRPRGVEEHHGVVAREVGVGEDPRVLVRMVAVAFRATVVVAVLPVDRVAVALERELHRWSPVVDPVGVPVTRGARVEHHAFARTLCVRRGCNREHPEDDRGRHQAAPNNAAKTLRSRGHVLPPALEFAATGPRQKPPIREKTLADLCEASRHFC